MGMGPQVYKCIDLMCLAGLKNDRDGKKTGIAYF
jgi:hypothetical protein